MRIISALTLCAVLGTVILPAAAADAAPAAPQDAQASVAGTWALTVETAQGTGRPTVKLQQNGEKLTGTYASEVFGERPVTGTVKGTEVTFAFTGSFEGTTFTVTYAGRVENDAMKGRVTLGDFGEGTFTGTRK